MKGLLRIFKVIFPILLLSALFLAGVVPVAQGVGNGEISPAGVDTGFRSDKVSGGEIAGSPSGVTSLVAPVIIFSLFVMIVLAAGMIKYKKAAESVNNEKSSIKKEMEKFQFLVENADDGILVVKKLKFLYANKRVYDMMGLAPGSKVSNNLVDYIHPDDLDIVLESYEKSILSDEKEINFEVRLIKPDKSEFWIHNRFVPVQWDSESVNLAFMRDITSKKMMERDLHQAQRLEAIGALSGGIAHEFNNILTTIIGSSEVALLDLQEEDLGRKEFARIRESGHRASDLVRQILTISREHTLDVQPLYLTPIIKEGLKFLRSTLATNIRIVEKIDKDLHLVRADSIQMYQVFMNLCTNAKHAMERVEDPCLEVELKNEAFYFDEQKVAEGLRPGNYVSISVKDNGSGIPPEIEGRLFEPYFSTKNKDIATGLGLTTTLGIVKQFEGHITFQSEAGEGSCFVIYLPVYETAKKSVKRPPDDKDGLSIEGNILFVDDEKEITVIAKKMFENLGFSVITANSGREALQYFSRSPDLFDVLITDLAMPEMTGEGLVKEVAKIRPGFPVVMCTGHSDTFDEASAKASGVVEYVIKPYNLKELSSIVSKYINKEIAA